MQTYKCWTEGIGALFLSQLHTWAAEVLSGYWHPALLQQGLHMYPCRSYLLAAMCGVLMI